MVIENEHRLHQQWEVRLLICTFDILCREWHLISVFFPQSTLSLSNHEKDIKQTLYKIPDWQFLTLTRSSKAKKVEPRRV